MGYYNDKPPRQQVKPPQVTGEQALNSITTFIRFMFGFFILAKGLIKGDLALIGIGIILMQVA